MIHKENLEQRLQELGWTLYKLAKQYSQMRTAEGDASPATRYHSAIGKAMENPAKSKLETIEGIVQALNGELRIIWEPGKVITLRLDDEQIAALNERANTEGKTVSQVAEQLLRLALSGELVQNPKKLTELVIAEETKIYRSMHPLIETAYSAVHRWLETKPEAEGYKQLDYSKELSQSHRKTNLKSIAFQFYTLFGEYFFEAAHVLENIINSTRLPSLLKHNPRICILDVGCAMGAASAAFIERVIALQQSENISTPIEIVCLGVDSSIYGLALYKELMQKIKQNVSHLNINVEFQYIPILEGFSKAILTAMRYLQQKRQEWEQPVLSNLLLMQLDVVSSPHTDEISISKTFRKLKEMGLQSDFLLEIESEFWQEEALGYKQLLSSVPVEELHILTIGTKSLERYIQNFTAFDSISNGIHEINKSLSKVFEKSIKKLSDSQQQVYFTHPADSYWYEQNKHNDNYYSNFDATFHIVNSSKLEEDKDWNELISQDNLELAWVRARKNLLDESLYDQVEIRIFENNFQQNLQVIREKLTSYKPDTITENQDISYNFPKSFFTTRPKQISRLDEEIIATAIMQTVGKKTGRKFSSYRIQKDNDITATEYLYENWFDLYKEFLKAVKESATQYQHGAVIRTDIKSYYKTIVREKLIDATIRELNISSERIIYLLKQIYSRDLDGHETGRGIKQGTLTSGFYQNFFLSELDDKFNNDKKWRVKFHRYVDDMILFVPNVSCIEDVEATLNNELKQLELELNEAKTEYYDDIPEFLNLLEDDDIIERLSKNFNQTLYLLWVMNADYRNHFYAANQHENNQDWWRCIKIYQQCLYSIKIYVEEDYLSRKIYQNLFQAAIRQEHQLNLPPLPKGDNFSVIHNWARYFEESAKEWLDRKNSLKQEIISLFKQSIQEIREVAKQLKNTGSFTNKQEKRQLLLQRRRLETRIRFAVNKLAILGFDRVWQEIVSFIRGDDNLFVIRDLIHVVISLARQGYTDAIKQLSEHYQNSDKETSEYIRAVILEALRFLPSFDVQDWELIFAAAVEGISPIERLKATETWLYLSDVVKPFVQPKHIQAVVNVLKSKPQPFTRLKKNYILILGLYAPEEIPTNIISPQELDDYLIRDALQLIQEGKVTEIFKENEPTIVRRYYSVKNKSDNEDTALSSLSW